MTDLTPKQQALVTSVEGIAPAWSGVQTAVQEALPADDDWLSGATACSIENGADCEACQ